MLLNEVDVQGNDNHIGVLSMQWWKKHDAMQTMCTNSHMDTNVTPVTDGYNNQQHTDNLL